MGETRTLTLPLYDGSMIELQHLGIMTKIPGEHYNEFDVKDSPMIPWMLQPWVANKIKDNKNILKSLEKALKKVN